MRVPATFCYTILFWDIFMSNDVLKIEKNAILKLEIAIGTKLILTK